MAKKPQYYLQYKLNAKFCVHIDPAGRPMLLSDLARGEVALVLAYTIGSVTYSANVYPDGIKDGALTFTQVSEDTLQVAVGGSYFQKLDPKWEQDTIDIWSSLDPVKVHSNQVFDSAPTSHYINGSDDAVEIGTVSFVAN
jgi:hypothetical protein